MYDDVALAYDWLATLVAEVSARHAWPNEDEARALAEIEEAYNGGLWGYIGAWWDAELGVSTERTQVIEFLSAARDAVATWTLVGADDLSDAIEAALQAASGEAYDTPYDYAEDVGEAAAETLEDLEDVGNKITDPRLVWGVAILAALVVFGMKR